MPSPFPGMDPYIEMPELWSDFHSDLAAEIRARLNQTVQPNYFARLIPYVTYEVVEVGRTERIRPDVAVSRLPSTHPFGGGGGVAVLEAPVLNEVALDFPLRVMSVEIRSVVAEELVTVIEILSPVNKRPGHDAYRDYQRKRREILHSEVHLMEIDLLRGGTRPPLVHPTPAAPYYVTLSRATTRPRVAVWPLLLDKPLPVLPVPLLEPDPDVALDLGAAVASVYERGAYALQIDYRQPVPAPPLSDEEAAWVADLLRPYQAEA